MIIFPFLPEPHKAVPTAVPTAAPHQVCAHKACAITLLYRDLIRPLAYFKICNGKIGERERKRKKERK